MSSFEERSILAPLSRSLPLDLANEMHLECLKWTFVIDGFGLYLESRVSMKCDGIYPEWAT